MRRLSTWCGTPCKGRGLRAGERPRVAARAIALFKIGIGCHGFGVLDKAVLIVHSHGLTADGKTVAPYFEQGDGPGVAARSFPSNTARILDMKAGNI